MLLLTGYVTREIESTASTNHFIRVLRKDMRNEEELMIKGRKAERETQEKEKRKLHFNLERIQDKQSRKLKKLCRSFYMIGPIFISSLQILFFSSDQSRFVHNKEEGMEDHSDVCEDDDQIKPEGMEDHCELSDDQIEPADEVIISYYLNMMINNNRKSWPNHFLRKKAACVYNENPWFESPKKNYFVFVERRTEACGKTDGCIWGCWRVMARDIVIKNEETGRILGFKKILKFCEKEKKRLKKQEIWVMEEYRLVDKWKQDRVICRIRLLLQPPALSSLLAKHFSFLS